MPSACAALSRRHLFVALACVAWLMCAAPASFATTIRDRVDLHVDQSATSDARWDGELGRITQIATGATAPAFTYQSTLPVVFETPGVLCQGHVTSGDFNGDGHDDVATGCFNDAAPGAPANSGGAVAYVWDADAQTWGTPHKLVAREPEAAAQCGDALTSGDMDGDGDDEVVLGCPGESVGAVTNAGRFHVLDFDAVVGGFVERTAQGATDAQLDERCGWGALAVADLSGDGAADIVAGCEGHDSGGLLSAGAAIVLPQLPGGAFGVTERILATSPEAAEICGDTVATGDVDGDGRSDVLASCRTTDSAGIANSGSMIVSFTPPAGQPRSAPTRVFPGRLQSGQYCLIPAVGDVDGDRRGDLMLGCIYSGAASQGAAMLTRSGPDRTFSDDSVIDPPAPAAAGQACGISMTPIDVLGSGRSGIAVGCRSTARPSGGSASGVVRVYARNASNDGMELVSTVEAPAPVGASQCATATSGDLDGSARPGLFVACRAGPGPIAIHVFESATSHQYGPSASLVTRQLNRQVVDIASASLHVRSNLFGQHVSYQLSNDGGATWSTAVPDEPVVFAQPGGDLRARIAFQSSGSAAAVITSLAVSYVPDDQPPTLDCTAPAVVGLAGGRAICTATDPARTTAPDLSASFGQQPVAIGSDGVLDLATLSEGSGEMAVTAVDAAGNTTRWSQPLTVDRTRPRIGVRPAAQPRDARKLRSPFISIDAADDRSGVTRLRASWRGKRVAVIASRIDTRRMRQGRGVLVITATDAAGNRLTSRTRLLVDRTGPRVVHREVHALGRFASVSVADSLSGVDAATVRIRSGVGLGRTIHRITVRDRYGNATTARISVHRHPSLSRPELNGDAPGLQRSDIVGTLPFVSDWAPWYPNGSTSRPLVREIQWRLQLFGYMSRADRHTGVLDMSTIRAVQRYQRARGLPVLGTVGPRTRAHLDRDLARALD